MRKYFPWWVNALLAVWFMVVTQRAWENHQRWTVVICSFFGILNCVIVLLKVRDDHE